MLSYKTPVGEEEPGWKTPLTHHRSSKLIELQESIKTMMTSSKKDPSLKSKLPAGTKVPNAQGINELLDQIDGFIGKLDRRVVGEAR